jgi:parvulin-like peptidyl-prolyl isomerase
MMRRILGEPLLHFAFLGALLFVLFRTLGDPREAAPQRVVVSSGQIERLAETWRRTWQRPPTRAELEGLVAEYVREEILYREALALGLDRDDTIVRRRLRQKMEFLSEDLGTLEEASEEDLQSFLAAHPERFQIEARLSFRHVFLSRERRGEAAALQDATRLLVALQEDPAGIDAEAPGDPLPLRSELNDAGESEVERTFGSAFAEGLRDVTPGRWQGPIASAYGLHLVFVRERTPARQPVLAEVRQRVQSEWLVERRREANESVYRRFRERYEVVIENGGPAAGELSSAGEAR